MRRTRQHDRGCPSRSQNTRTASASRLKRPNSYMVTIARYRRPRDLGHAELQPPKWYCMPASDLSTCAENEADPCCASAPLPNATRTFGEMVSVDQSSNGRTLNSTTPD